MTLTSRIIITVYDLLGLMHCVCDKHSL